MFVIPRARPDQDGAVRRRLRDFNECITCTLCAGYLIDATTISDCMHSFCRSCIIKHLQRSTRCPRCPHSATAKPIDLDKLRRDPQLRALVYKLVAGLSQSEAKRRQRFEATTTSSETTSTATEEAANHGLGDVEFIAPEEPISLSLQYHPVAVANCAADEVPAIKYLQCPAAVTVQHLQRFLASKFSLNFVPGCSAIDIQIIRSDGRSDGAEERDVDEILPETFTLMDVAYCTRWRRVEPLRLYYQILVCSALGEPDSATGDLNTVDQPPTTTNTGQMHQAPTISRSTAIDADPELCTTMYSISTDHPIKPTKVTLVKSSKSVAATAATGSPVVKLQRTSSADFKSLRSNDAPPFSQFTVATGPKTAKLAAGQQAPQPRPPTATSRSPSPAAAAPSTAALNDIICNLKRQHEHELNSHQQKQMRAHKKTQRNGSNGTATAAAATLPPPPPSPSIVVSIPSLLPSHRRRNSISEEHYESLSLAKLKTANRKSAKTVAASLQHSISVDDSALLRRQQQQQQEQQSRQQQQPHQPLIPKLKIELAAINRRMTEKLEKKRKKAGKHSRDSRDSRDSSGAGAGSGSEKKRKMHVEIAPQAEESLRVRLKITDSNGGSNCSGPGELKSDSSKADRLAEQQPAKEAVPAIEKIKKIEAIAEPTDDSEDVIITDVSYLPTAKSTRLCATTSDSASFRTPMLPPTPPTPSPPTSVASNGGTSVAAGNGTGPSTRPAAMTISFAKPKPLPELRPKTPGTPPKKYLPAMRFNNVNNNYNRMVTNSINNNNNDCVQTTATSAAAKMQPPDMLPIVPAKLASPSSGTTSSSSTGNGFGYNTAGSQSSPRLIAIGSNSNTSSNNIKTLYLPAPTSAAVVPPPNNQSQLKRPASNDSSHSSASPAKRHSAVPNLIRTSPPKMYQPQQKQQQQQQQQQPPVFAVPHSGGGLPRMPDLQLKTNSFEYLHSLGRPSLEIVRIPCSTPSTPPHSPPDYASTASSATSSATAAIAGKFKPNNLASNVFHMAGEHSSNGGGKLMPTIALSKIRKMRTGAPMVPPLIKPAIPAPVNGQQQMLAATVTASSAAAASGRCDRSGALDLSGGNGSGASFPAKSPHIMFGQRTPPPPPVTATATLPLPVAYIDITSPTKSDAEDEQAAATVASSPYRQYNRHITANRPNMAPPPPAAKCVVQLVGPSKSAAHTSTAAAPQSPPRRQSAQYDLLSRKVIELRANEQLLENIKLKMHATRTEGQPSASSAGGAVSTATTSSTASTTSSSLFIAPRPPLQSPAITITSSGGRHPVPYATMRQQNASVRNIPNPSALALRGLPQQPPTPPPPPKAPTPPASSAAPTATVAATNSAASSPSSSSAIGNVMTTAAASMRILYAPSPAQSTAAATGTTATSSVISRPPVPPLIPPTTANGMSSSGGPAPASRRIESTLTAAAQNQRASTAATAASADHDVAGADDDDDDDNAAAEPVFRTAQAAIEAWKGGQPQQTTAAAEGLRKFATT